MLCRTGKYPALSLFVNGGVNAERSNIRITVMLKIMLGFGITGHAINMYVWSRNGHRHSKIKK